MLAQPALASFRGDAIQPRDKLSGDDEIIYWLREHIESAYHPCGTCKIGPESDQSAVVNSNCQVYGVTNLRVVDASVFPTITNGNINAPTIMVAEKVADIILAKKPLQQHLPVWVDHAWKTRHRQGY